MRVPNRAHARRSPRVNVRNFYAWELGSSFLSALPSHLVSAWNFFGPLDPIVGPDAEFSIPSTNYDEAGNAIGLSPRIDAGKGLWGGPQVANLLPVGAADSATWGKTNCTVAGNTATISGTSAQHYLYFATATYTAGVSYTASYRIKKSGGQRFVQITGPSTAFGVGQYANFDLELGVVSYSTGCTAQIIPDDDGFYWCHFTAIATTITAAIVPVACFINDGTSSRLPTYTGDGIASLEIDRWMLSATAYPAPYVPPGATQPSNAATTGNNGLNIPMDAGMLNCLGASGASAMTLMHEAYMGVGGADLGEGVIGNFLCCTDSNAALASANKYLGTSHITRTSDGTNTLVIPQDWSPNEIHRRYCQTSSDGTMFRVGYQRFNPDMMEITAGIQWSHPGAESTWAAFDGSFNPLTYLRFGLNLFVPVWHRRFWLSNKTLTSAEINEANQVVEA